MEGRVQYYAFCVLVLMHVVNAADSTHAPAPEHYVLVDISLKELNDRSDLLELVIAEGNHPLLVVDKLRQTDIALSVDSLQLDTDNVQVAH